MLNVNYSVTVFLVSRTSTELVNGGAHAALSITLKQQQALYLPRFFKQAITNGRWSSLWTAVNMSRYLWVNPSLRSSAFYSPRACSTRRSAVCQSQLRNARDLTTTCRKLSGTTGPARKQVTVASDDGTLRWGELSAREKAARATQQSINFMVVLVGAVMTVVYPIRTGEVFYYAWARLANYTFYWYLGRCLYIPIH